MMLQSLLADDFKRRIGNSLNDKESSRLTKTIEYYMKQVANDPENSATSLQNMNRQVLQVVVPDFMSYIKRQNAASDPLLADVSSRFEKLQTDRQTTRAPIPSAPNFQLSLDDAETVPAINRYEELKRIREMEAKRLEEAQNTLSPLNEDMVRRNQSDDDFRMGLRDASARDSNALAIRQSEKNVQRSEQALEVPPDARLVLFGQSGVLPGRGTAIPNANPTLTFPDTIMARGPLPQDNIKPQTDVINYRENEYNLTIYSADRDWTSNKLVGGLAENRYNFVVNFDPANNSQGFGATPSTYIKFKNIARIEMVKIIVPLEGIETLTLKTGTAAYDTSKIMNVLSFPYVQLRVDELNNNNYGTNDGINNSFAIMNYDATWTSDSNLDNYGYTCLIPKFMKCQKIYHPTPLSTLQKLTITINRPDGSLVSSSPDALDLSGAVLSNMLAGGANYSAITTQTQSLSPSATVSITINYLPSTYNNYVASSYVALYGLTNSSSFIGQLGGSASSGTTLTLTTSVVNGTVSAVSQLFSAFPAYATAGSTTLTPTSGNNITITLVAPLPTSLPSGLYTVYGSTSGNSFTGTFVSYVSPTLTLTVNTIIGSFSSQTFYIVPVSIFQTTTTQTLAPVVGSNLIISNIPTGIPYPVGAALTVYSLTSLVPFTCTIVSIGGNTITVNVTTLTGSVTGTQFFNITGTVTKAPIATILTNSVYNDTSGEYIWVQTKTWFSRYTVSQGDRVVFKNITYPPLLTANATAFVNYLTQSSGHVVVDIGYSSSISTAVTPPTITFFDGGASGTSGSNKLGYSNYIIIRNQFNDPTTGSVSLATMDPIFLRNINRYDADYVPGFSTGRGLNMNHQVQVVFRVITRDLDSAVRLRPDNM